MMKKKIKNLIAALSFATLSVSAQTDKPTIAVIAIDSKGTFLDSASLAYMMRLELEKTKMYNVMDKYDVKEAIRKNEIDVTGCFGKSCVVDAGKKLGVDKMFTGDVEHFENKVAITVKIIDIKTAVVEKSDATEFIDVSQEMQRMIRISIQKLLELPTDGYTVDMLVNYDLPVKSPKNELKLNGPRMGFSMVTGETKNILTAEEGKGGFNMYPATFLFGWQQEVQYLSSGNFQALVEFIPQISGLESGQIIPHLTLLNGFRASKSGWEIAVGPSFRLVNKATGFFYNNNWTLEEERANIAKSDSSVLSQNIYPTVSRLDSRGDLQLSTSLVIGIGKTIRSGYLNIPLNVYFSPRKEGSVYGFSFGFNIYSKKSR